MSKSQPVWITGLGTANPLGADFGTVANNLLDGRSGVVRLTDASYQQHPCQIAGRLGEVPVPPGWTREAFGRLDGLHQLILWCCGQALRDAGLWEQRLHKRVGLVLGVGAEWLRYWEMQLARGEAPEQPIDVTEPGVAYAVRRQLELNGPATVVAAACASGNVALAQARRWVQRGWVDLCLAGGCDMQVTPISLACFGNMRVLSRRNDAPGQASRPFDRNRDGFVVGEGGAMFVLEPAASARRRGARVYAEFAGHGATSDATHLVIPSADPAPAARALRSALADAAVAPDHIDYMNAHGTSTTVGDAFEARVVQTVLGDAARRVPVSSTKSMTGHLLSAAAAVEALACLVALDRQAAPPTINLDDPDPECNLCHVPHEARPQPIQIAVSNSFGFGGSNSCVVFRKVA